VIVHDLYVFRACGSPSKADPVLIVHPDAVLPGPLSLQSFQPVARRHHQILQTIRDLKLSELASRDRFDVYEPSDPIAVRKRFHVSALERSDHGSIITRGVMHVKRDARNA
jgi:hypothetical protein